MNNKNLVSLEDIQLIRDYPHLLGNILGKDKLTELHSDWIKYIWDTDKRRSLQGHRGSYKTTAITIIGAIWELLFYPDTRIAIVRKSFTDAADCLKTISQLMKTSEALLLFKAAHGRSPKAIVDSTKSLRFNFKNTVTPEGNVDAYGIDTGITGRHYDKIICDDIITLKDRISKAERENTKNVVYELQANIIDPGKPIGFIGTPWHKDDAWSIVPKPVQYNVYSTGILSNEEIIEKRKLTTGSLFAANYDLKHIAAEDALFKNAQFASWEYVKTGVFGHVDAAYSGDNTTALTFFCRKSNKKIGAVGFIYNTHIKEHYSDIIRKYKKYFCGTLYNETNADKGFVAGDLKHRGCIVKEYDEKMNKHVKITTYLKEIWDDIEWADETDPEYINQILDYIEGQEPDDAPDSAASLARARFSKKDRSSLYSY